MIKLVNVNKKVDSILILKDINFSLPSSGLIIIKGINGVGKSTLLNMIGGLDKPSSGMITFDDFNISNMNEKELLEYRENYISFVFQDTSLFENMNVIDNITIVGNNDKLKEIITFLSLEQLVNKKVKLLSGGEKQRTAIARALVKDSKILICDEPTSSLDYNTKENLFKLLKSISENRLIIMVSHDVELINSYADMIIELNDGKILHVESKLEKKFKNEVSIYKNNFNKIKFVFTNFFVNKKKLFFSTILLTLSFLFIFFSLALSTLDYVDIHTSTMLLENDNMIIFNANEYESKNIDYLNQNKISKSKLFIGKKINVDGNGMNFGINYDIKNKIPYYQKFVTNLSFFSVDDLNMKIIGSLPINNNEIIISSYLADLMIKYGVMDSEKLYYYPTNYQSLIEDNKEIILGTNNIKIVGIYEMNLGKYDILKEKFEDVPKSILSLQTTFYEIINNIAGNIYVNADFFNMYSNIKPVINQKYNFALQPKNINGINNILNSSPIIFTDSVRLKNGLVLDELEDNEIIINEEIINQLNLDGETCIGKNLNLYIGDGFASSSEFTLNLTIKGVSLSNDYYINKKTAENYIDKDIYIGKIFINEKDENNLKSIFTNFPLENNEYTVTTNYSQKIMGLTGFIDFISKIFIVINIIFIILTIIILINYILNSIELHKKDIGILKALGVKNVQSLFKSELVIIVIIPYIISILLFFILGFIFNNIVSNILSFKINLFSLNVFYVIFILIAIFVILLLIFIVYSNKIKKISPETIFRHN